MAVELRSLYSEDYVELIAAELAKHNVSTDGFIDACFNAPWEEMTLKERAARITSLLNEFLPDEPTEAIAILKEILPPVAAPDAQKYADMLSLFVPDYVVLRREDMNLEGIKEALCYFTHHGTSSELAVRPFIQDHHDHMMSWMQELSTHPHDHVRRFSSEGCRPRLPWAMALPALKKDPTPIFPILENLVQDNSKFVQKSVANNLNDIAKDNPDAVLDFAKRKIGTHPNTDWILRHGLRTLLKASHPDALALFGMNPVQVENAVLTLENSEINLGEKQHFQFNANLIGPLPERLRIEYAVDFMKARGKTSRKVFMFREGEPDSSSINLAKSHNFTDFTTRKHYAGDHKISILVNGTEVASESFTLKLP
ncbi:hypothetical protein GUA87_05180 [Sneathiella sp. P13V-1]|uniref:DNA alkylation repair protein n=1 Tax=Sneathiella sp. P13V-1 TaxID=2697366 RepID=UPI00187B68FA|nr:DNA alkylation repair protein [Sneathiella sp. P13V-1]MBE7636226.1 hypothetical protein [Sneathiella sp. P13V-1]